MITLIALVLTLAAFGALGVLFGADSRDGLDWAPDNFRLPRRPAPRKEAVRRTGSPAPAAAERGAADGARRSLQAIG